MIELTRFAKDDGPLTKRISLGVDGKVQSDGSACVMSAGDACRVRIEGLQEFAELIGTLKSEEAIALGALRSGLPDRVRITTKQRLDQLNGHAAPDVAARSAAYIQFRSGEPALVLIDIDRKGMPAEAEAIIRAYGGFQSALGTVLPALLNAGGVVRSSTSSGLSRSDTGEVMPASGGLHWYIAVKDGTDSERFLKVFHARCWLHGFGWMIVSASGQLLERSLIDRMVFAPERLVFEGPPVVVAPLEQDQAARDPRVTPGEAIDTRTVCPDLTAAEAARFRDLRAAEAYRLRDEVDAARSDFISRQATRLVARLGVSKTAARRIVERQCEGVLLPGVELPFDAEEFSGSTVADVLSDPDRFVGSTLADPIEGVEYGRGKAKIMRRQDGTLWIHSFAHGRASFELKHDASSVEAAIRAADPKDASEVLVDKLLAGDLEADEEQRLRDLVVERGGVKPRPLALKIKEARAKQAAGSKRAERARRTAERTDKRRRVPVPPADSERLPVLKTLDQVLGACEDPEPPMRDLDECPVEVRVRQPLQMHELSGASSNADSGDDTRLPPPELPLLTKHDKFSMAHLVERHIEFVVENDEGERSVALPQVFIDHYIGYRDSTLPQVGGVVTTPLVLGDGTLLAPIGLDRERKLVFRIDPTLLAILPKKEDCGITAVAEAIHFLINDWLVDVATDFAGKCMLIAIALTIIERVLLQERPAFFITAGQRGGGKTTAVSMLLLAVTGKKPPAAAWSQNEEERRKALFAYMLEGLPCLVWDNLPRGAAISCPHIEKALTLPEISDRVLGGMKTMNAPSTTIHLFTGNNVGPRGDMASRSGSVRLTVDRTDPENRPFVHPDPTAWTLNNRGEILRALYTVMLGNPQLKPGHAKEAKTRFKTWYNLVGSAVENAAKLLVKSESALPENERQAVLVDFAELFNSYETEEEQTCGLAGVVAILQELFDNKPFTAADVARFINTPSDFANLAENPEYQKANSERRFEDADEIRARLIAERTEKTVALRSNIEQAHGKAMPIVSPVSIGKRLTAFLDAPVRVDAGTVKLARQNAEGKKHDTARFEVRSCNP